MDKQQLIRMYHIPQSYFMHKEDWRWPEFNPRLYSEIKAFMSLPKSQIISSGSLQKGYFHLMISNAVLRFFHVRPSSSLSPWNLFTYLYRRKSQTSIQLFLVLSYCKIDIAGQIRTLIANASFKPSCISAHFYNEFQNVRMSCAWLPKCLCSLFSDR